MGSVNVSLLDVRYQCIENEKIEGCSDSSVNAKQSMHSINGVIDRGNRMMKDKFGSHRRLLEDFDDEYVFSIGKAKSGLAFHQHTQSYNALIHGGKRWYLYAPGAIPLKVLVHKTHRMVNVVYPSLAQRQTVRSYKTW